MSRKWSEHHKEWSLYCSYDSSRLQATERTSPQEKFPNSDTLSTDTQRDDMSSRPASSSSSDSLYAPPSPPTLRRIAQTAPSTQYTSLRDVPPLSLDRRRGAVDHTAHRGIPISPKTPPTVLSPPESYCYQHPAGLTHPLPDPVNPVPRGPLRVVNRDPPPLGDSSSTPIDGHSRIRLKARSARSKMDFTDPFAEKKDEPKDGLAKIQAALSERRKVDADLQNVTDKLETAFKEGKSQNSGGVAPSVRQSWCDRYSAVQTAYPSKQLNYGSPSFNPPPEGMVWAGLIRLPDCHICQKGWDLGHLHSVEEELPQQDLSKKQAEEKKKEQEKERLRVEEEKLKRVTEMTWHWPNKISVKSPVNVRSPTTTSIKDVSALRPEPLRSVSTTAVLRGLYTDYLQTEPKTTTSSDNRATTFVENISKLVSVNTTRKWLCADCL